MILKFGDVTPEIHETVFTAPSADIIGDVKIGKDSSVWFGSIVRGDMNYIRIGQRTNIQDLAVIHIAIRTDDDPGLPAIIGNDVTVGHSAVLHACTVQDACLVGMGSVILDGAVIGTESVVAAGSLVTKGKIFPPRSMVMGSPAKAVRELTAEEVESIYKSALIYIDYKNRYC